MIIRPLWQKNTPYIIAEAGVNHNGCIYTAIEMIDAAKEAGAHCVKFQAFTTDELVLIDAPTASYQKKNTGAKSQHEMLKKLELSKDDLIELKRRCNEKEIDFMVTPFSANWVEFLTSIGVIAFKIGSGNTTDPFLIEAIGKSHLPVIISTGMCDLGEVRDSIHALRAAGATDMAILHCVSLYPTPLDKLNLKAISTLANLNLAVGFSDHSIETVTGMLAIAAGATILEKHFTLDQKSFGPDHKMSLEPEQLSQYVTGALAAYEAMGDGIKRPCRAEQQTKKAARLSLVAVCDIEPGTKITKSMLTAKRPGSGIPAEQINDVLGKITIEPIKANQLINMKVLQ
ncbi:MAG: N-acetylneuraminate synthase family protein [Phycisphaerae bacterium]|nr:N-acetylneuraminate synthase family protein [Phycisphaerae bacterium]